MLATPHSKMPIRGTDGGSTNSKIIAKLIATGKFDYSRMKTDPSKYIIGKFGTKEFKSPAKISLVREVLETYSRKLKMKKADFTNDRFGSWELINAFIKDKKLDYEEIKTKYNEKLDIKIHLLKQSYDFKKTGRHRDLPQMEAARLV